MIRDEMYYEPDKTAHGLHYDPFKSCVIPRPIGWISTVDAQGRDNLAPYSQFQNVSFDPPIVMFSANQNTQGSRKDSVNNAEQTKRPESGRSDTGQSTLSVTNLDALLRTNCIVFC